MRIAVGLEVDDAFINGLLNRFRAPQIKGNPAKQGSIIGDMGSAVFAEEISDLELILASLNTRVTEYLLDLHLFAAEFHRQAQCYIHQSVDIVCTGHLIGRHFQVPCIHAAGYPAGNTPHVEKPYDV